MPDYLASLDPRLSAAILAAGISFVFSVINIYFTYRKFKVENALAENTNRIATKILSNSSNPYVSINLMSHFLGGYNDNEVRQILLRAGAIRLTDQNGLEVWALYARLPTKAKSRLGQFVAPAVDDPPRSRLFQYQMHD